MKQTSTTKKLWLAALLVALLATLLCFTAGAETVSGTCGAEGDNVTWTLDTETGELTISGEGKMADYDWSSNTPWNAYRSDIKKITFKDGVTHLGHYAFYNCTSLTEVTIPDSVTNIGNATFSFCSSLAEVNFPKNLTKIDSLAFQCCSALTEVTIPESVTHIDIQAFLSCAALASITVDEKNPVYHSAGNCLIETSSKTLIAGCKNSVIPDDNSVTKIGISAFGGCSGLTSIHIPDGVNSIDDMAFQDCSNLASVTIPDSVTRIGYGAFSWGFSLTEIHIPDSVTYIGEQAFEGCELLASITVDQNNPNYHSAGNCLIETESKTLIAGCNSSVIPADNSVTSIDKGAFYALNSLASATVPESVTSIGERAFYACWRLSEITFLSKTVKIYDSEETIFDATTIYGYAGSTAEAYASKYGRTFVAIEEPEKLIDASLISYQVTKSENGEFSLRAIAGLNSLDYKNFGYEITITTKDENGNDVVRTLSGATTKAYSSIFGGTTEYSIKEHFGYEYAGLATITNLAIDSSYTKIEIRSYVTTLDGEKQYGKSGTLLYTGTLDDDGYPSFETVTE